MSKSKSKNTTMEILKFLAASSVVMVHCMFPGILGKIIFGIGRFSVPTFYMVSGYFIYNENSDKVIQKLPSRISRLLKIWVITDIIYFFIEFLLSGFSIEWVGNLFNIDATRILEFVFLQETWQYFVWYLFASILCYISTFVISKYNLWNKSLFLIFPLLLVNLFIGEALPFITGETSKWFWCSNFWLFAFPFYATGYGIRIYKDKILEKVTDKLVLIAIIGGFFLNMAERAITHASEFFVSTYIMTVSLFLFSLKFPNRYDEKKGFAGKIVQFFVLMGNYSLYIYLIHPAIIVFVRKFISFMQIEKTYLVGYLTTISVVVITFILAFIVGSLNDIIKKKKLSN